MPSRPKTAAPATRSCATVRARGPKGASCSWVSASSWPIRAARHEVVLFQVVAPEEEDFTFKQPTQFRNLERAGHHVLADPHRLRKQYLEKYRRFCTDLARECGNAGVEYLKLRTDSPYDKALGAFLDMRVRRTGRG